MSSEEQDAHNRMAYAQRQTYYKEVHNTKAPSMEEEAAMQEEEALLKQKANRTPHKPTDGGPISRGRHAGNAEDPIVRQQLKLNTTIRAAASDHADALISKAETLSSHIAAKAIETSSRLQQSLDAVQEVEDNFRWCLSCGWNPAKLCKDFQYGMEAKEISQLKALGVPDPLPMRSALNELATRTLSKGNVSKHGTTLDGGNKYAPEPFSDFCVQLYEFAHADVLAHVRHEVSRTDSQHVKLQKMAETINSEMLAALKMSDVIVAEKLHVREIDVRQQLVDLFDTRLKQALLSADDTSTFQGQMMAMLKDSNEVFEKFQGNVADLRRRIEDALKKSDKTRTDEDAKHQTATEDYTKVAKDSLIALRDNGTAQERVFSQIKALTKELESLAEQRKDLVEEHSKAKEAEEKRIFAFHEMMEVHRGVHEDLLTLRDQNEATKSMSDALIEYHAKMNQQLLGRDLTSDLDNIALDEAKLFLKEYREFVFCAGGLLTKKQHRADTVERQQRLAKLQHETAVDALDPEIDNYAAALEDHALVLTEVQGTVTGLQAQLSDAGGKFLKAEEVLMKHEVQFEHPMLQYADTSTEERKKFVERALRYVEGEEREVERKTQSIVALRNLAAHQRPAVAAHEAGSPEAAAATTTDSSA